MKAYWGTSTLPMAFMALLAFGLLLQQFLLAADITAITLGQHILADGADAFTRNHPAADR